MTWYDLVNEMFKRMNGLTKYDFRMIKPGDVVYLGDLLVLEYGEDKKFHQYIVITDAVSRVRQYCSEKMFVGHINPYYHRFLKSSWLPYDTREYTLVYQQLRTTILCKKFDIPLGKLRVRKFKYMESEE